MRQTRVDGSQEILGVQIGALTGAFQSVDANRQVLSHLTVLNHVYAWFLQQLGET